MPSKALLFFWKLAILLLLLLTTTATALLDRIPCSVYILGITLYTSGYEPPDAVTDHCSRCIAAFAAARYNTTQGAVHSADAIAPDVNATLSCHAVFVSAIPGLRALCRGCDAQVAAIQNAFENPTAACTPPMNTSIAMADTACQQIALSTLPFGGTFTRLGCRAAVYQTHSLFFPNDQQAIFAGYRATAQAQPNANPNPCVLQLEKLADSVTAALATVPSALLGRDPASVPVITEFAAVGNLSLQDLVTTEEVTPCYVANAYSLAGTSAAPFCSCLIADSTNTTLSPMLASAQNLFRDSNNAAFGIDAAVREAARAILVDAALCLNMPADTFLTENGNNVTTDQSTPSPRPSIFTAPHPYVSCFPASATVRLEDGTVLRMDSLRIGDRVQVGPGHEYSSVFMFTHRQRNVIGSFVRITCENNRTLLASPGHFVLANGKYIAAEALSVGDWMSDGNGDHTRIRALAAVTDEGLYNPQTIHGHIVVNDLAATTFTVAVEPRLARRLLKPFQGLFSLGLYGDWFGPLDSSGHVLSRLVFPMQSPVVQPVG